MLKYNELRIFIFVNRYMKPGNCAVAGCFIKNSRRKLIRQEFHIYSPLGVRGILHYFININIINFECFDKCSVTTNFYFAEVQINFS